MSLMQQYLETKRKQKELEAQLAKLESNTSLQQLLDFEDKLKSLMEEYSQTPESVMEVLGITSTKVKPVGSRKGATRPLKLYVNPNTGEKVETKGGNHKVLNAWRTQYGKDTVDSWLQN